MRTTKEIAADCGFTEMQECVLDGALSEPLLNDVNFMIHALYRRIEVLEMEATANLQVEAGEHDWHVIYHEGGAVCISSPIEGRICTMNQTNKRRNEHARLIIASPKLLENCVTMQSRVRAIRAVPEAMDALCSEDVFGGDYAVMLSEDDAALRAVILAAGGQLAQGYQADVPGEKEGDNQ